MCMILYLILVNPPTDASYNSLPMPSLNAEKPHKVWSRQE